MARVLLIEDADEVRRITVRLVRSLGLEVQEAASADAAKALGTEETFDAVLLDWDLPGSGALEVLSAFAAPSGKGPVFILAATENDSKRFALARAAGAGHVVLKPYARGDLAAVFARAGFEVTEAA